jgi:signal transduction histidine kinase
VDIISTLKNIHENNGLEGIVYDLKNFNDKILAATGIGLYELDKQDPVAGFRRVSEFSVECSTIEIVGDNAILGCNNGTFVYDGKESIRISQFEPWKIIQSKKYPELLYASLEHGLGLISYEDGKWRELGKIQKLDKNVTSIAEDENGQLWLGTERSGIIKVLPIGEGPKDFIRNESIIEYFDAADGLPSKIHNKVFWVEHPIFTTHNGIYLYEEERGFYQDSTFGSDFLKNPRMVKLLARDQVKNIWVFSQLPEHELTDRNEVSVAKFNGYGDYDWQKRSFEPFSLFDVNAILPDGQDKIWFGGKGGILYYDGSSRHAIKKKTYSSLIRRITINGDSLLLSGQIRNEELSEKLPFQYNSLKFNYAAPAYRNEDVNVFQVYLEGYDQDWSSWNTNVEKEYTNLMEGKYTFRVRARNALNEVSEIASFGFEVEPPWFRTFWAYLIYAIISIMLIFSVVYTYTFRLNKSKLLLENKVRERTKELQQANSSIIEQNIEIKNKNEKIRAQKDELKSNLVRIKDATKTIEEQNTQLKEMNSRLEGMVQDRTRKLNQVVRELQISNNELDQFIYRSSHDLRGPVARLLGLVYLMRNDQSIEMEEYLTKLEISTLELDKILNRLMKSRQIAKKEVRISKVRVSQLIQDMEEKWSKNPDGISRKLTTQINQEHELKTDPELLHIMVHNLVDNAQKFKDGNKPNPYVNVDFSVQNSDQLRVTIEDNGIGISTNIKENIYEMFFVGSNISTGLGLGLYEARVIAHKLNGELKLIESNADKTVFEVSLPLN